jgi:hypothetical protein
MASRARVLTAGDDARGRVVRDLHDGAQQRLVPYDRHPEARAKSAARGRAARGVAARRGARSRRPGQRRSSRAVRVHQRRSPLPASTVSGLGLPVETDVTATRLPPEVEASVYFVVAEALTNVVKHSQATWAQVTVVVVSRTLRVESAQRWHRGSRPRRSGVARHGRSCGRTPRPAAHRHFARRRDPPGRGAASLRSDRAKTLATLSRLGLRIAGDGHAEGGGGSAVYERPTGKALTHCSPKAPR